MSSPIVIRGFDAVGTEVVSDLVAFGDAPQRRDAACFLFEYSSLVGKRVRDGSVSAFNLSRFEVDDAGGSQVHAFTRNELADALEQKIRLEPSRSDLRETFITLFPERMRCTLR
jgi:hypothetical protein